MNILIASSSTRHNSVWCLALLCVHAIVVWAWIAVLDHLQLGIYQICAIQSLLVLMALAHVAWLTRAEGAHIKYQPETGWLVTPKRQGSQQVTCDLHVTMDFGFWILISVKPHSHRHQRFWLSLQRSKNFLTWHLLRCALYMKRDAHASQAVSVASS